MSYTTESGRTQILEESAAAADRLGVALAALGEAYEHLDDQTAERMEDGVFRPLQAAYGQLKRTIAEFAERYGLSAPGVAEASAGLPADPRATLERVAGEIQEADVILADLQDSMLPVEVGDQVLREGLSRTRSLIGPLPAAADQLIRTFGR